MNRRCTDEVIDQLAACQHGVVARAQLCERGVSPRTIDHWVMRRRLKLVHRGVYRVGPVAGQRAREMAAVLACGSAVVSHRSAPPFWQWLPSQSADEPVDVIVMAVVRRRIHGITAHRVRALDPRDVVLLDGVPVTTPARTLLDLAGVLGAVELERVAALAERLELVTASTIMAVVDACPRHRGAHALRALFAGDARPALTRSEAESRLLQLIRKARLRTPQANARLHGYEVDFLWAAEKLVVEVDGFAYHASPAAFTRDRRRDAALTAAGFRVLRVTWPDITTEPEATLVRLAQALAH